MLKKIMHFSTDFLGKLLSANSQLGLLQFLAAAGLAYVGGLLASLTPCVYPMIPITIGVIGGTSNRATTAEREWGPLLLRGCSYIFGMAVTYSFLGVLAGLTGKVFGTFTNTVGWYLALGMVMNLTALVMMDIVPFDPLSWWQTLKYKLGMRSSRAADVGADREMTLLGVFVLGASSGFIAAPCTTPVLTSILAYIAQTQSIGLGLVLMFAFSLGLGTLLLLVGIFTGALQILPRSGNWMKRVKIASGVLLLAFAEYLIFRAGRAGGSL